MDHQSPVWDPKGQATGVAKFIRFCDPNGQAGSAAKLTKLHKQWFTVGSSHLVASGVLFSLTQGCYPEP